MIPASREVKLYTETDGLEWPGCSSEESCSWSWLEIIV